jgi:hypothetical protein
MHLTLNISIPIFITYDGNHKVIEQKQLWACLGSVKACPSMYVCDFSIPTIVPNGDCRKSYVVSKLRTYPVMNICSCPEVRTPL